MNSIPAYKILVVDDDVHLLDITLRTLKNKGYTLFSAQNGAECLEILEREHPDIILLDVMLPDVNGKDLCKKIKNNPEFAGVFIILLSALKILAEDVSEGLEEGADGYIRRPVEGRELLARIGAACRVINAESRVKADQIILKACIDSPKDMIVLAIDNKFNYLAFNTFHEKVMIQAYGAAVSVGMNLMDCITNDDDIVRAKRNYQRAMDGESHITIEEYGEIDRQYYETRYNPIFNEKNEIIGATAFSANVSERMKMVESLKRSEEKFRKGFTISPDSININRLSDGLYISINEGFTNIIGYTESDVLGKTSSQLNIWVDTGDRERLVNELRAKGRVENLEAKFRSKNGTIKTGLMSASVLDLEGILHILSITRDITDQKTAEDALRESERMLRESQSIARLGSFVWDIKANTWKNSKILDEIFGIDDKYVRSLDGWLNLVHPEWKSVMSDYVLKEVMGKQVKFDKEYQIIRKKNKSVRWVHGLAELELDGNCQPVKLIGTILDITDRKNTEQALRESEIYFADVFESVNVGVAYTNREGKVLAVNSTLESIVEIPRKEIEGKNIVNLSKKLLTLRNFKAVMPLINSILNRKDVDPFQVEYKNKILEISTGRNLNSDRITGIIRDVTNLVESENTIKKKIEELEWFNKMMINREVKMIELKKEINELLNKNGEEDKYIIHERDPHV